MALARDPVCGMMVDPATAAGHLEHGATTYHFCSPHCVKRFAADPARFLAGPKPGLPMSGGASGVASMASESAGMASSHAAATEATQASGWKAYVPLITVFAMLLLATLVLAARDAAAGTVAVDTSIARFMAGFFLVFAGFKLLDLRGFADGYATYDLLAKRVPAYGYVYPFIELLFGLFMVAGYHGAPLLWAEIGVMGFSGVGVAIKLAKKEQFQCACLGTFLKVPLTKVTLVEDFGMAALALALLVM